MICSSTDPPEMRTPQIILGVRDRKFYFLLGTWKMCILFFQKNGGQAAANNHPKYHDVLCCLTNHQCTDLSVFGAAVTGQKQVGQSFTYTVDLWITEQNAWYQVTVDVAHKL